MRRILAITLLIAFGSPLVLPLFAATADPQSNLPACCRRNGAHHCSAMAPNATGTPSFTAPPCPRSPTPAAPLRLVTASLAAPLTPTAAPRHTLAPTASGRLRAHTSVSSANLKRGPPALLA